MTCVNYLLPRASLVLDLSSRPLSFSVSAFVDVLHFYIDKSQIPLLQEHCFQLVELLAFRPLLVLPTRWQHTANNVHVGLVEFGTNLMCHNVCFE